MKELPLAKVCSHIVTNSSPRHSQSPICFVPQNCRQTFKAHSKYSMEIIYEMIL